MHKVALTADISKMYRAVELTPSDKDCHQFVWRKEPDQPLRDYRMTRATFGVAATCLQLTCASKEMLQSCLKNTLWLQGWHKILFTWTMH